MEPSIPPPRSSPALVWTGRVISALPVLALLMSASMKFGNSPEMAKGFEHLGWPMKLAIGLGIVEISCTVLYVIPQTAVLGAILLTGYLGGAVATHARVGDPIGNVATPIVLGVLVWLGLYLRDERLKALVPLRS